MKTVTLVVEIVVQVPNETNSTLLHLNNSLEDFRVEEAGTPVNGNVKSYTTVDVIDDNEFAEEMDDEG
jgi:hypothetical protein